MTDENYEARVISFPAARGLTAMRETAAAAAAQQLASVGAGSADDWGRDPALVVVADPPRAASLAHARPRPPSTPRAAPAR